MIDRVRKTKNLHWNNKQAIKIETMLRPFKLEKVIVDKAKKITALRIREPQII